MQRSKNEFVERWKRHLAGLALYGIWHESTQGPLVRAGHALSIPAEVEKLLGLLYDDLAPKEEPRIKTNGTNGNGHHRLS